MTKPTSYSANLHKECLALSVGRRPGEARIIIPGRYLDDLIGHRGPCHGAACPQSLQVPHKPTCRDDSKQAAPTAMKITAMVAKAATACVCCRCLSTYCYRPSCRPLQAMLQPSSS